jgi:hypothetical protein
LLADVVQLCIERSHLLPVLGLLQLLALLAAVSRCPVGHDPAAMQCRMAAPGSKHTALVLGAAVREVAFMIASDDWAQQVKFCCMVLDLQ